MASNILVKIGADITDFSRKMADSQKALRDFAKANQATTDAFKSVGGTLTKYVTAPAAAAVSALTGITLVKGFGRLVGIDTARAKLGALGHDAESVEEIMNNALDAVRGTSYGLDEAATAAASAVAAGIKPGEELTKYLSSAGDAAAIAGSSLAEMGSIFGKVQTAQRAYTGELNQLADRGIPIFQWLAEEAGVTDDAVRDMASNGEISAEMFFEAISKNIGGAAKEIGETSFAAALKNIWSDLARIGANFLDAGGEGEGFFSRLKPLLSEFRGLLESLEEPAAKLGAKFGDAFIDFVEFIKDAVKWFNELSPTMQKVVGVVSAIVSALSLLAGPILLFIGFIPNIVAGFAQIGTVIKALTVPVTLLASALGLPVIAVVAIIAAVVALGVVIYKYWDEIKAFTIEAWGAIKEFFINLWDSISSSAIEAWDLVVDTWDKIIQTLYEIFSPIISFFVDLFTNIYQTAKENFETLANTVSEIWSNIKDSAASAWEIIKNVVLGPVLLLINLVTGDMEGFKENLSQIWGNISDAAKNIWENMKDSTSKIINGLVDIATNTWTSFKETVARIMSNILSAVVGTWTDLKSRVIEIAVGIVSDALAKWDEFKENTLTKIREVRDNVINPLKEIDLLQVGKDVISGLIKGIKSKVTDVKNAVKTVTDAITGKIKSILQIKSPSRLFKRFGAWTGEGFAIGIEDSVGMVEKASGRLAQAATPEIDMSYATPSGIKSSLSSAINGTVDVNSRDSALINAVGSLERRLGNLEVVMDGRTVGRLVEPHVSEQQRRDARKLELFRS